jgi:hypothetical protein
MMNNDSIPVPRFERQWRKQFAPPERILLKKVNLAGRKIVFHGEQPEVHSL